jgi:hypothetical protein
MKKALLASLDAGDDALDPVAALAAEQLRVK